MWKNIQNINIKDFTIVIPSVAVGNVGQLTCDLLISSLKMEKICSLCSPAIIPVLGYDPYILKSTNLSSSCELYICNKYKILVLQFRAPLVFKYAKDFLQDVISKFKELGVKDAIVLTSCYAHEKKHVSSSPFRFLSTELCPYKSTIEQLNWTKHESNEKSPNDNQIYGSGFATLLFETCKQNELECLLLYKYCSEGDNIPDAYDMIQQLSSILLIFDKTHDVLEQPVSWKLLFGGPPPEDVY